MLIKTKVNNNEKYKKRGINSDRNQTSNRPTYIYLVIIG